MTTRVGGNIGTLVARVEVPLIGGYCGCDDACFGVVAVPLAHSCRWAYWVLGDAG